MTLKVQIDLAQIITIDSHQCGGRPCIRGMRIRVSDILDLLAAGESIEAILKDYPDITDTDIRACLSYASKRVDYPTVKVA